MWNIPSMVDGQGRALGSGSIPWCSASFIIRCSPFEESLQRCGDFSFNKFIFTCSYYTRGDIMEKDYKDLEKEIAEEVDTFNNHWGTGHFLGPNTLRHEENREVYEEEDGE